MSSRWSPRRTDRTVLALLAITAVGLLLRLVLLGSRVAHQDESRVAYWTIRYAVNGQLEYRPIIHGPFLPIVNGQVFSLLGPTDFSSRLVVALLGAALPLSAWLFRERLRDTEVLALAGVLTFNPVLVYYSRFMRSDLLLAALMLFTFGFLVRAYDERDARYLFLAVGTFGVGTATKENVLLYPLCWLGAAALALDHRMLLARYHDVDSLAVARRSLGRYLPGSVRGRVAPTTLVEATVVLGLLATNPLVVVVYPVVDGLVLAAAMAVTVGALAYRARADHHYSETALPLVGAALVAGVVPLPYLAGSGGTLAYALFWVAGAALLATNPTFRDRVRVVTDPVAERFAPADEAEAFPPSSVGALRRRVGRGLPPRSRAVAAIRRVASPVAIIVALVVEFFAIVVFFYAPRNGGFPRIPEHRGDIGLYESLGELAGGDPTMFLRVVEAATLGSWAKFRRLWTNSQDHAYIPYFEDFMRTMGEGTTDVAKVSLTDAVFAVDPVMAYESLVYWTEAGKLLLAIAVVGFVADRYSPDGPRDVVSMASYWGFVSILGYPIVTDIPAPWATIHAIVPLAFPAAVGIALLVRVGRRALLRDDQVVVTAVVTVLVVLSVQTGAAVYDTSYANPADPDNELVQYAQSSSTDLKPTLGEIYDIAERNEGVDVLFYGQEFYQQNETIDDVPPAAPGGWYNRLPFAWYFEAAAWRMGDDGEFVVDSSRDRSRLETDRPPVVIALASEDGPVVEYLRGYEKHEFQRYAYASTVVVYVKPEALNATG